MLTTQQSQGYQLLESDIREQIWRHGFDPLAESVQAERVIDEAISQYEQRMVRGTLPLIEDLSATRKQLVDAICGFGSLQQYLDDPTVEEIWINSPSEVFIARNGESELTGLTLTHDQVRFLVERMLKQSGRRLDLSNPFVDASLSDLSVYGK